MAQFKACKKCKYLVESADNCPACGSQSFTNNWQGRISVLDANKSQIAEFVKIQAKGEYAIKIK